MVFGAVGGAAIHAAIQLPKDMVWASHQMMVSVSADQYKLTNIVKWEEIDKVNEMNTATLQN